MKKILQFAEKYGYFPYSEKRFRNYFLVELRYHFINNAPVISEQIFAQKLADKFPNNTVLIGKPNGYSLRRIFVANKRLKKYDLMGE